MNQSTPRPTETGLQTRFATAEQTEELTQLIELALEDVEQVSGGLAVAQVPTCQCVNCCSNH